MNPAFIALGGANIGLLPLAVLSDPPKYSAGTETPYAAPPKARPLTPEELQASSLMAKNMADLYQDAYSRMFNLPGSIMEREQERQEQRRKRKEEAEARFQALLKADADARLEALRRALGGK